MYFYNNNSTFRTFCQCEVSPVTKNSYAKSKNEIDYHVTQVSHLSLLNCNEFKQIYPVS